jgi:hypothetical protein
MPQQGKDIPTQLRAALKRLPFIPPAYALIRLLRGRNARFTADYRHNSGAGSDLDATRAISNALPGVLDSLSVLSMLDIPCGDFLWMRHLDLASVTYTGADIIETRSFSRTNGCTNRLKDTSGFWILSAAIYRQWT